jgi:drug/metabolite transporter (DMT)-like permease
MQVLPEVLSPFIGEVAALTAAGLWALASVIYGWLGQQISALALNVLKGCAAIAMLLLTIAGVAWVLSERTASLSYAFNPDLLKQGLAWAFVAEICQATGILLSRSVFLDMEISPLWSSLVRISAGTFTALLLFSFQRPRFSLNPLQTVQRIQKRFTPRLLVGILLAAFGGTFLGIWLQQTAVKYTLAGIAQTLSATSPLFAIPIAVVCREAVSLRSILGAIVSIIGIGVLVSAARGVS